MSQEGFQLFELNAFFSGEIQVFSLLHHNKALPDYYNSYDKKTEQNVLVSQSTSQTLVDSEGGMGRLKQKSTCCWSMEEFCSELNIILLSGPVARVKLADCPSKGYKEMLTQDTCIGFIGKKLVKIDLGKEAEWFFSVPDHFMDLFLFSINDTTAPQLRHAFREGTNLSILLNVKTYILVVA